MDNGQMMDMMLEDYKYFITIQSNLEDHLQAIADFGTIETLIKVT